MSDLKVTLNDKMIRRLGLADEGQYVVRDSEMKGFFIVMGKRKKTFTAQGECRKDGVRHWKKIALGTSENMSSRDGRVAAKAELAKSTPRPGRTAMSISTTARPDRLARRLVFSAVSGRRPRPPPRSPTARLARRPRRSD
jgi:hypothetical protein